MTYETSPSHFKTIYSYSICTGSFFYYYYINRKYVRNWQRYFYQITKTTKTCSEKYSSNGVIKNKIKMFNC